MDWHRCAPCFSNYMRTQFRMFLQCTHRTGNKSLTRILTAYYVGTDAPIRGIVHSLHLIMLRRNTMEATYRGHLCTRPVFCEILNQSLHKSVSLIWVWGLRNMYDSYKLKHETCTYNSCKDDTTKEQQIEKVLIVNRTVELLVYHTVLSTFTPLLRSQINCLNSINTAFWQVTRDSVRPHSNASTHQEKHPNRILSVPLLPCTTNPLPGREEAHKSISDSKSDSLVQVCHFLCLYSLQWRQKKLEQEQRQVVESWHCEKIFMHTDPTLDVWDGSGQRWQINTIEHQRKAKPLVWCNIFLTSFNCIKCD